MRAIALVLVSAATVLSCRTGRPRPARDSGTSPVERQSVPSSRDVLNVAHRGASGHAPEHTLAAYDMALAMGADHIEQDLQLTKDSVLVALHDATLDRTARGPADSCKGLVIEKTFEQIRTCDVGSWFNEAFPDRARREYAGLRIPALAEVFERYGPRANYYIETKNPEDAPGMEEALLRLLGRFDLRRPASERQHVLVQSFSAASLRKIHALDPRIPLVQLFSSDLTGAAISEILDEVATYAVGIGPSKGSVNQVLLDTAHSRCLVVHPYTVNDTTEMRALIALGVDGMFTDFPARLETLLAHAELATPRPNEAPANRNRCRQR